MNKRKLAAVTKKQRLLFAKTGISHFREKLPLQTGGDRSGVQGRKRTGIYRGKIQVRCILRFTFEAVDFRKQEKIRRTALFYLCRYGYPENTPCRFDVVGITGSNIQLIRNAF